VGGPPPSPLVIAHPRRRREARRLFDLMRELSPGADLLLPESLVELAERVRQSAGLHQTLIVLGGDGTVNRVLNSMDPARQVLCPLPFGSGNDLSSALGWTGRGLYDPGLWAGVRERTIDLATAASHRFHNSGGLGIDSATLALRRRVPRLLERSYTTIFLLTVAGLRPLRGTIRVDGSEVLAGAFFWVLAMNSNRIGGGLRVTPEAELDDGRLDFLVIEARGKLRLLYCFPRVLTASHLALREVHLFRGKRLELSSKDPLPPLALDGELYPLDEKGIKLEVVPGGLPVLVPPPLS